MRRRRSGGRKSSSKRQQRSKRIANYRTARGGIRM